MARDEAPPFARGETYYNGVAKDAALPDPLNILGKEWMFEPASHASSTDSSGRPVWCRCVQNKSGQALLPKHLAVFKLADPTETQVDGYTFAVTDRPAGMIDEFLPAAGVASNDIFWLVIDGPTVGITVTSALTTTAIGSPVVPGAGTSKTTNADAGRLQVQSQAGATTVLGGNLQNVVGYAEAVNSTADTDLKIVIHRRGR